MLIHKTSLLQQFPMLRCYVFVVVLLILVIPVRDLALDGFAHDKKVRASARRWKLTMLFAGLVARNQPPDEPGQNTRVRYKTKASLALSS